MKFIKKLKIVELASVLAGPSVGYFFAELGARVIKIENKTSSGDVTRSWKLPSENKSDPASAYFYSVNAYKKHIFLDLLDKADYTKCIKAVASADIVICNFKKGDDQKLGLSYAELKKINPTIIYASVSGFGEGSPRTAYDLILQAESGFMSMNGTSESGPVKMPVALIDLLAAHQLKEGILLALLKRNETGKGSKVTVSLFDSAIASLANQATNWLIGKHIAEPIGSLHPNIAPYGEIFETKDKHLITFAIGNDRQFEKLLLVLGLKPDPELYGNNLLRIKNRKHLFTLLAKPIRKLLFADLFYACSKYDIPVGKIRNIKEVFELPEAKAMLRRFNDQNKTITNVSSLAFRIT